VTKDDRWWDAVRYLRKAQFCVVRDDDDIASGCEGKACALGPSAHRRDRHSAAMLRGLVEPLNPLEFDYDVMRIGGLFSRRPLSAEREVGT
jgi:hypothetical protein